MQLNLRPHDQRVARDGSVKEVKVQPYVRICVADYPPVFLQEGRFFAEEVGVIDSDELPEWVIPELAKCNVDVLKECKCPDGIMQDVQRARAAYNVQQKAAAEERRKRLYGNNKNN
jgi:hypothetical protein